MSDIIRRVILNKYPDYDFERHHFKFGDVLRTNSGALILVIASAIYYVEAYILKSGFGFKRNQRMNIGYNDLPYYKKGEFISEELPISKKLKWELGSVVIDPRTGSKLLIEEEASYGGFYALVLDSENKYYIETRVYVTNPYKDYMIN